MRVLEAAVKKLRIIVLVTSCALLGSTQQGCNFRGDPNRPCSAGGGSCNPARSDEGGYNPRCCGVCIANPSPPYSGPAIGGRCR